MHSLSDEELINVIMSKKDKDSLADDPMKFEKFWPELGEDIHSSSSCKFTEL